MTGTTRETFLHGSKTDEVETQIRRRLQLLLDIERRNQQDRDVERASVSLLPKPKMDRRKTRRKGAPA
jgi:hypothetical protein